MITAFDERIKPINKYSIYLQRLATLIKREMGQEVIIEMSCGNSSENRYSLLPNYSMSVVPEMVSQLNLPYEAEYKIALTIHKPNK